jgi:hypothetical protein
MALTNAQRKQAYRAKLDSMDLTQESVYVHNDDKQALRIYAARLRQARGCSLPTDSKILDAAIDDLPAPADSQILADSPVQAALVDPTIAQTKIDSVAAVVARFEAMKKTETSPRWEKAVQFIRDVKEALRNE